jgi:hypothetical protein
MYVKGSLVPKGAGLTETFQTPEFYLEVSATDIPNVTVSQHHSL